MPDRALNGRRIRLAIGIALLGVAVAAYLIVRAKELPMLWPDSASYIAWKAERTPGYPLFLRLLAFVDPAYRIVPPLQFAILIVAAVAFCDSVAMLLRSWGAALIIALMLFGNLALMRYSLNILTDSLFFSLLLFHAAFVLRGIGDGRLRWPVYAGLALGLAILVRPVGYALLFALPWLFLLWHGRILIRTLILAGITGAMILFACLGNYFARGYFATEAFGGINLIMQVATLAPAEVPGFDAAVSSRTYEKLAPLRDSEQAADDWESRVLVSSLIYNSTRAITDPAKAMVDAAPQRWQTDSPYWREIAVNALATDFAHKVIAAEPVGYLKKVAQQFYGLWFLSSLVRPSSAQKVTEILVTKAGMDRQTQIASQMKTVPNSIWFGKMVLYGLMFAASIAIMILALLRRDPVLRGLGYLALVANCYFGVVALMEVSLPRYSFMMWPFQWAILLGFILWLWRAQRKGAQPG